MYLITISGAGQVLFSDLSGHVYKEVISIGFIVEEKMTSGNFYLTFSRDMR